jgi:uncharacterized protein YdhG (YjbR/CyaY superfamily)
MKKIIYKNIDAYIANFPKDIQVILESVRQTIKKIAPEAEEGINYQMPAFKLNGALVYFAAYKTYIGFYAAPTSHEKFKEKLAKYKQGKGSVQFPINKPMPLKLIGEIVKFRIQENMARLEKE